MPSLLFLIIKMFSIILCHRKTMVISRLLTLNVGVLWLALFDLLVSNFTMEQDWDRFSRNCAWLCPFPMLGICSSALLCDAGSWQRTWLPGSHRLTQGNNQGSMMVHRRWQQGRCRKCSFITMGFLSITRLVHLKCLFIWTHFQLWCASRAVTCCKPKSTHVSYISFLVPILLWRNRAAPPFYMRTWSLWEAKVLVLVNWLTKEEILF